MEQSILKNKERNDFEKERSEKKKTILKKKEKRKTILKTKKDRKMILKKKERSEKESS